MNDRVTAYRARSGPVRAVVEAVETVEATPHYRFVATIWHTDFGTSVQKPFGNLDEAIRHVDDVLEIKEDQK